MNRTKTVQLAIEQLGGTVHRYAGQKGWVTTIAPAYVLNGFDPAILIVRPADDSVVIAFSAEGATREEVCDAAETDWRKRRFPGAQRAVGGNGYTRATVTCGGSRLADVPLNPARVVRWEYHTLHDSG